MPINYNCPNCSNSYYCQKHATPEEWAKQNPVPGIPSPSIEQIEAFRQAARDLHAGEEAKHALATLNAYYLHVTELVKKVPTLRLVTEPDPDSTPEDPFTRAVARCPYCNADVAEVGLFESDYSSNESDADVNVDWLIEGPKLNLDVDHGDADRETLAFICNGCRTPVRLPDGTRVDFHR